MVYTCNYYKQLLIVNQSYSVFTSCLQWNGRLVQESHSFIVQYLFFTNRDTCIRMSIVKKKNIKVNVQLTPEQ